jgi:hypothetical protein
MIGDFSSLALSVTTKASAVAVSRARTTAVDRTLATELAIVRRQVPASVEVRQ